MKKHKLPSGNTIEVKPLAWEASFDVCQEVMDFVSELKMDFPQGLDIQEAIMNKDIKVLLGLKSPLLKIIGNKNIRELSLQCLEAPGVLINGKQKFTRDYFADKREDFLIAAFWALDANITPFGEGLISLFSQGFQK